MAHRSHERSLLKFSIYSTCVVLPKKMLATLGWQAGDVIRIRRAVNGHGLLLERSLRDEEESARPSEVTHGEPVTPDERVNEFHKPTDEDVLPIPEL